MLYVIRAFFLPCGFAFMRLSCSAMFGAGRLLGIPWQHLPHQLMAKCMMKHRIFTSSQSPEPAVFDFQGGPVRLMMSFCVILADLAELPGVQWRDAPRAAGRGTHERHLGEKVAGQRPRGQIRAGRAHPEGRGQCRLPGSTNPFKHCHTTVSVLLVALNLRKSQPKQTLSLSTSSL